MKLTLLQVQKQLPQGLSVTRKEGEYIVRFKGVELIRRFGIGCNPEAYTYYTDDLGDALGTAHAMANHTGSRNSTKLMQRVEDSNAGKLGYNETNQLLEDLDAAIQVKRGRGRPRKVVELPEEPVIKRGPGRPRKVVELPEEPVIKRGPGRPRKVVQEASEREPMEITRDMILNLINVGTVRLVSIEGTKVTVMEPNSGSYFFARVGVADLARLG